MGCFIKSSVAHILRTAEKLIAKEQVILLTKNSEYSNSSKSAKYAIVTQGF